MSGQQESNPIRALLNIARFQRNLAQPCILEGTWPNECFARIAQNYAVPVSDFGRKRCSRVSCNGNDGKCFIFSFRANPLPPASYRSSPYSADQVRESWFRSRSSTCSHL